MKNGRAFALGGGYCCQHAGWERDGGRCSRPSLRSIVWVGNAPPSSTKYQAKAPNVLAHLSLPLPQCLRRHLRCRAPSAWPTGPACARWENAAAESKQISGLVTPRVFCWLLLAAQPIRMRLGSVQVPRFCEPDVCFSLRPKEFNSNNIWSCHDARRFGRAPVQPDGNSPGIEAVEKHSNV
jgi:hypothetical protein